MSILTWNDLYRQLWIEAAQSRGTVTSIGASSSLDATTTTLEWPRTTGEDAITIVTLIDPILAALPLRHGVYGISRVWHSAVLEVEAFEDPADEYRHNRNLWSALLSIAAYFDAVHAPLPDQDTIAMLLSALWTPIEYRNAGPTSKLIVEGTTEKMWTAQRDELATLRGADVREPTAEVGGQAMRVPRSTNADVVKLADYWERQLSMLTVKAITGGVANTAGLDGQIKRWQAIKADVDNLARKGGAADVYPKNHQLWHATMVLSASLAAWGEVPSTFELVWDSTGQAVKDLPGRVADAAATAAKAAGHLAHEVGTGLLTGLGKPLVIGAAALAGLFVVFRLTRPRQQAHT